MPIPRPPHPETFNGDLANPPAALTTLCLMRNWVVWKWQRSTNAAGYTKPPFCASIPNRHARNDDPRTWDTRSSAVSAVLAGKADGIGFELDGTMIGAIDLDKCISSKGAIDDWAQAILDLAFGCYIEKTVSGKGLRILGLVTGPNTHRRLSIPGRNGAGIELYRRCIRYITISGLQYGKCTKLTNIDSLIDDLLARYDKVHSEPNNSDTHNGNTVDDIDHLIRYGVHEGLRSEAFSRVVWSLAGQGLSQAEIEQELRRYPKGIAAKYLKRLSREVERCYTKWRQENQSTRASHNWGDPDWSILDDRRGELPELPIDVLTPPWQEWLKLAAHGAGVRSEHIAIPLLGVASSLIGTARRVCASRSWFEPMTLWACVVADSGDRKTPGLRVTTRALDFIERRMHPAIAPNALRTRPGCSRRKRSRKNGKKSVSPRLRISRSRRLCRSMPLIQAILLNHVCT
jgi:Protein of unknown function (DUF3987)